jgi:hypothetical protein
LRGTQGYSVEGAGARRCLVLEGVCKRHPFRRSVLRCGLYRKVTVRYPKALRRFPRGVGARLTFFPRLCVRACERASVMRACVRLRVRYVRVCARVCVCV